VRRPPRLLVGLALIAGVLGSTLIAASPGQASGTNCHTAENSTTTVCLYVDGSGNQINYTVTYMLNIPGRQLCDRRAWNSGMNVNDTNYWARSTSIQPGCVTGYGEVRMNHNTRVGHPSWFYGQYYTNGRWQPGYPKVLVHI
jgi:hypothetical protein